MPRYREPFTIFPRKLTSGNTVYYYRTYNLDGSRSTAHSTGKSNKTLARNYCMDLLKRGLLGAEASPMFATYAEGFFDNNSTWYKEKIISSENRAKGISKNTLKAYRHCCKDILIPFFKNLRVSDFKPRHVRMFREKMVDKGFSNSSINLNCVCLKIILEYAIADGVLTVNPFASIKQMRIDARVKNAFTIEQLEKVFEKNWSTLERKVFCLTAAVTGMRISEVAAIRRETLFKNYIDVKDQLSDKEFIPVKTGEKRKVVICKGLYNLLSYCIHTNRDMAFSENIDTYRQEFYRQAEIEDVAKREKLGLTFHSLRHFVNTYLLSNNIAEIKVKSVLGHSSGKGSVTERYTNFLPEHFKDVEELQEQLLLKFSK